MSRHIEEYRTKDGTLKHYHYPTIEDMFNQKPSNKSAIAHINKITSRYVTNNNRSLGWFGIIGGYDGVMKTVKDGWQYGLELIEQYMSEINLPRKKSTRRRKIRSDQGNEVDIHRILNGDLNKAWSKTVKVESFSHRKGGKRISIVVNLSEQCSIKPTDAFWKGACAVTLAKTLMAHGYSVEINVIFMAYKMSRKHDYTCISTTVKQFNQRMNLELIAAMTSVGFLRGPMFVAALKCEEVMDSQLGYPELNNVKNQPLVYFENRSKMTIVIKNIRGFSDAKAFEKNVEQQFS